MVSQRTPLMAHEFTKDFTPPSFKAQGNPVSRVKGQVRLTKVFIGMWTPLPPLTPAVMPPSRAPRFVGGFRVRRDLLSR